MKVSFCPVAGVIVGWSETGGTSPESRGQMSAPQRLHGEDPHAALVRGSDFLLHICKRAALNSYARPVDQRMDDLDLGKMPGGAHCIDKMRAHSHRAQMPQPLLLEEVIQRLFVSAKRIERFLLMQHEQIDIIPSDSTIRALQSLSLIHI